MKKLSEFEPISYYEILPPKDLGEKHQKSVKNQRSGQFQQVKRKAKKADESYLDYFPLPITETAINEIPAIG